MMDADRRYVWGAVGRSSGVDRSDVIWQLVSYIYNYWFIDPSSAIATFTRISGAKVGLGRIGIIGWRVSVTTIIAVQPQGIGIQEWVVQGVGISVPGLRVFGVRGLQPIWIR